MQASEATGGQWPHEMVFTFETNPQVLTDLLYARAVWGLPAGEDIPPAWPAPTERAETSADPAVLAAEWESAWEVALAYVSGAETRGQHLHELMPADGEPMSEPWLLAAFTPPAWEPIAYLDRDAIHRWQQSLPLYHERELSEHPERRSITETVEAWRRGLTTVIVIPVAGDLARQLTDGALLLSHHSYEDQPSFQQALRAFGPSS